VLLELNKKSEEQCMKILLIDDEPVVLRVLQMLLKSLAKDLNLELILTPFTDPRQAVEALKTGKFDLVISDWNMPNISQWSLVKKIREICPKIQVIIVSSGLSSSDKLSLRTARIGCVAKPVLPSDLRLAIEKAS